MGSLIEYFGYILIVFSVPLYLLIKLVQKQIANYRASIKDGSSTKTVAMNRVKITLAKLLFYFVFFIFCGALIPPGFLRSRGQGQFTACESNLKYMGTALEMYRTDNDGLYPDSTLKLVPKYLKQIPICPTAGKPTYLYEVSSAHSAFTIYCEGRNHRKAGISKPNYPQYKSKEGFIIGK